MVFGFPGVGLRIEEDQAFEFRQEFLSRTGQQSSHVIDVHAAAFIQRNQ